MPIHNSYIFHRNAFKNESFLKEKNKNDLFEKYSTMNKNNNNFHKTDNNFLTHNRNNNYIIPNATYSYLSKNTFPYDITYNKINNI